MGRHGREAERAAAQEAQGKLEAWMIRAAPMQDAEGPMEYQRVSLKVCEGCGTLWFRRLTSAGVYCAPCVEILQHFPDPKTRRKAGRPKKVRGVIAGGLVTVGGAA